MDRSYKTVKQTNYLWLDFIFEFFTYGFSVARGNLRLRRSIERALLDAGIGVPASNNSNDNRIVLQLPRIDFRRNKDGLEVIISNSIKFQKKLLEIDISSALYGYIVESFYLSEDRTKVIYECEPVGVDYQIVFDNFREFKSYISQFDKQGYVPIDSRLIVPLSHMLITGMTGSGKTTALYYLLLFFEFKYGKKSIFLIDPKEESLAVFGRKRKYRTAIHSERIMKMIKYFVRLMEERKKEMRKVINKSNKFDSDALSFGFSPKFIFIDELSALNVALSKEEKNEFYALLSQVILLGRSLGFFVIISLQQYNAKELPTSLSEQIGFKVVLGNSGKQSYLNVFGSLEGSEALFVQKKRIGEGIYFSSHIDQINPKKVRFPHLKFLG